MSQNVVVYVEMVVPIGAIDSNVAEQVKRVLTPLVGEVKSVAVRRVDSTGTVLEPLSSSIRRE